MHCPYFLQYIACCLHRTYVHLWYVQTEVTGVLLEGNKGGRELEGVAMKNTIARRFEELDWDNNGETYNLCERDP